jgi:BON domain-containing protein
MSRRRHFPILLVFVSLCLAACGRTPSTPTETVPGDAALMDSIKVRLFNDSNLKVEPVVITASNGEVTLAGEVSSEEARRQIVELAQTAPGVTKVTDSMQIKPEATAGVIPAAPAAPARNSAAPAATTPAAPPPAAPPAATNPAPPVTNAAAASNPPVTNAPPVAAVQPPPPPPPPKPKKVVVPEGTSIQVVTIDSIDSKKDKVGGTFMASLNAPLTVGEQIVAPKGSNVSIKLLGAATSGNFKGKSELHLALDSIEAQGKRYPVQSSTYSEVGKSQGKSTAKKVGIGAAVGGTIGAIVGGGKGAAIGAGVGAGGGAATQVLTKGDQVNVPSETTLEFKLEMPLEITIQPK